MRNLTLIKREVEIYKNDEGLLYNVYWSNDQKIFIAICTTDPSGIFGYKLSEDVVFIAEKHRAEILKYCLGSYTQKDTVSVADVFLWDGGYLESIF